MPVLFADASPDHIPTPIRGWTRYVIDTEDGYDGLYRRLTGQPRLVRPELGTIRPLPSRERRWSEGTREAVSSPASPQPPPLHDAAGSPEAGFIPALSRFFRQKNNRQVVGWLGGILVALIGGAWAVSIYLLPPGPSGPTDITPKVESRGGVAAGRDIKARDIIIEGAPREGTRP